MKEIKRYYGTGGIILQILLYFFITIYPNYLLISYSVSGVMDFNKIILNKIKLLSFFQTNKEWLNFIIIFSVFYVPAVALSIKGTIQKKIENSSSAVYLELLFAFSGVVGQKKKRFSKIISKTVETKHSTDIFFEIAKPKQQIVHLSEYLQKSLENICVDKTIKISILYCQEDNVKDYLYISDDQPNISIEELNNKSLAKKAIETKEMKIYRKGDKCSDYIERNKKISAILCYPIKYGKDVVLCINVTSKSNHPLKKENEILEFILSEFERRFLLEFYLLKIRKELHNEEN